MQNAKSRALCFFFLNYHYQSSLLHHSNLILFHLLCVFCPVTVDTMGFLYLVDFDEYPKEDVIHCIICKTGIGLANDFIDSMDYELTVVFHKMYNVQVDEEKYHRQVNGNTVADTYCVKCGMLLGMKLIVVPYSNRTVHFREGNFLMNALELVDCNNKLMYIDEDGEDEEYEEDDGGANEHDHDQGGGADEQNHDDGGANEHDQDEEDDGDDGGANEHNHDQGGGVDEQNHDDGGANEHDQDEEDEEYEEDDGGANEHDHDQGGGADEHDHDNDGGANEHHHDQGGGADDHDNDGD
ncbi:uncharacterized protein LOC125807747 [Solanum verrucosum]|uniref:uncharacterized protein LOC125807747 n=1 Tax=Solanum verrucosum TaxID=315347 RepID=UPI0020D004CB|nr:uncharacterized protein LOC125807747 [Solanum verrucosum]